jgi:hypothetical protein
MLVANLYYTSMRADEVKPDRSMLVFIGRLADMQNAAESAPAVAEILHGMAMAPKEVRRPFICSETLTLTAEYVEQQESWSVQVRSFEAIFFMTSGGTCNPQLWTDLELIPRMARAAGQKSQNVEGAARMVEQFGATEKPQDPNAMGTPQDHVNALFELTIRTLDCCVNIPDFLQNLGELPDLDLFMLEVLGSSSASPHLSAATTHLMSGLLQSEIREKCWANWKRLGIVQKIVGWFKGYATTIRAGESLLAAATREVSVAGKPRNALEEQRAKLQKARSAREEQGKPSSPDGTSSPQASPRAEPEKPKFASKKEANEALAKTEAEVLAKKRSVAGMFDQMMNLIAHAVVIDPGFLAAIATDEDLVYSVSSRLMDNVDLFVSMPEADPTNMEQILAMNHANTSFRIMAQILTCLTASDQGLTALSNLEMEGAIVSVLLLPRADYTIPAWMILCTLTAGEATLFRLIRHEPYHNLLANIETALNDRVAFPEHELEYAMCVLDRICCYPENCLVIPQQLMLILCLTLSVAQTVDAKLLALRAMTRCAFADPELLDLMPVQRQPAQFFLMAACQCLHSEKGDEALKQTKARLRSSTAEWGVVAPHKGRLGSHFSRSILAEAVSVSRKVCNLVFAHLDGMFMLGQVTACFLEAHARAVETEEEHRTVCADVLNELICMLQTITCSTFRQGDAGTPDDHFEVEEKQWRYNKRVREDIDGIEKVLDALVYFLKLDRTELDGDNA